MFSSTTTLIYDSEQDILRAILSDDLDRYYKHLFYMDTFHTRKMFNARYKSHITVYNPAFHGKRDGANIFNNIRVLFQYNPENIYRGGQNKGFEGYYLPIISEDIKNIQMCLGISEEELGRSLHLTLFTNKHYIK